MRSRRRAILAGALAAGAAALGALWPRPATAAGIRRVAILETHPRGHKDGIARDFVSAMTRLGYVEGKDVEYLHRHAEGDSEEAALLRLGAVARELVRSRPDAIVTAGTRPTQALARATTTIPIVTNVGDPIRAGFAKSFARPGGNVTGVALASPELFEKTFAYLKAIIPGDWSVAVAVSDHTDDVQSLILGMQAAAGRLAIPVRTVSFKGMDAVRADQVLASLRGQGVRVLSPYAAIAGVPDDVLFTTKYGLVTVPAQEDDIARGALLGYWSAGDDVQERKAAQVARILRGAPAGEIPFETPRRYQLWLNRRTARLLGLTIPREVLLVADKIYD